MSGHRYSRMLATKMRGQPHVHCDPAVLEAWPESVQLIILSLHVQPGSNRLGQAGPASD